MDKENNMIVGFDLCNDNSQISCYDMRTYEPKSICVTSDDSKYMIPTVLAVKKDTLEWYYGEEAISLSNNNSAVLVKNIIDAIIKKESIDVYETRFMGVTLLEKFFRKTLSLLKRDYPNEKIGKLMITIKELDRNLIEAIYEALSKLGLQKDRVSIQSHAQSYLYYALSQKKELWMNDIGLFDFDEKGLCYYQISINRKVRPFVVTITEKDYSQTLSYDFVHEIGKNEHLTYIFENIAKSELHKHIISTLYVTGKGFEGKWSDDILKELCIGRRVFKGQNLYTKGACYAAKESVSEEKKLSDFLFISDEMITSTISMKVYHNAKIREIVIAKAATAWYDVEQKLEIILDDENEIEFVTTDLMNKKSISQMITLDGLETRPNKMTRLEIRAKFEDEHTCVVTVKDKGFGEFYPSSNRIYEKVIKI